jgi:hypothetical protein
MRTSSFCGAVEITLGTNHFQRALGKGLNEKKWMTRRVRAGSDSYSGRAQNFDERSNPPSFYLPFRM